MKGVILLNGERFLGEIDLSDSYVVCCDGAVEWVKEKGIKYDVAVGDFDSLGYVPEGALVYPCEKDFTDGELALDLLLQKNISRIEIYGGGGKREDHFFGNVGLLITAHEKGVKAVFITDYTEFYIVDGKVELNNLKGNTVSMFPISKNMHIHSSIGMKYPMQNLELLRGRSRGLSNVVTEDYACINIDSGYGLFFIVRMV